MNKILVTSGNFYYSDSFKFGFLLQNDGEIIVEPVPKLQTFFEEYIRIVDLPDSIRKIAENFNIILPL